MRATHTTLLLALAAALLSASGFAEPGGKLLATGGVTQFEGSAGGGLTPWALIGGYATEDEIGGTLFATGLRSSAYDLTSYGVAVGFRDRVELSLTRQDLRVGSEVIAGTSGALVNALTPILGPAPIGNARATNIEQDVLGLKIKLFGDAVYAQDTWLPQVSLGVQHKRNRDFGSGVAVPYLGDVGIPALLGARDASGTDVYLSATKVILGVPAGKNLLLNATLRATRGNAFGLLGFGRRVVNPLDGQLLDEDNGYELEFEGSAALFLSPRLALGAEFRTQSSRLQNQPVLGLLGAPDLAREDTAWDVFLAYVPTKRWAFTLAWVDVGNLPFEADADGAYLSAQFSF